jgi:lycopene cyclase domain-containing protein
MAATYLILDIWVVAAIATWIGFRPQKLNRYRLLLLVGILLLMTAVFDNAIIAAGIVAYDISNILGSYIGKAPVEDFCYAIVAAVLVPYLWNKWGKK